MGAESRARAAVGALLVVLVLGVAACGSASDSGPAAAPPRTSVAIEDYAFSPATIRVAVGGRVTWRNADGTEHTATANDRKTFDSGTIRGGGKAATVRFSKPGRFAYYCEFHPYMHGTVVVAG